MPCVKTYAASMHVRRRRGNVSLSMDRIGGEKKEQYSLHAEYRNRNIVNSI
jgi:hypothetical protein